MQIVALGRRRTAWSTAGCRSTSCPRPHSCPSRSAATRSSSPIALSGTAINEAELSTFANVARQNSAATVPASRSASQRQLQQSSAAMPPTSPGDLPSESDRADVPPGTARRSAPTKAGRWLRTSTTSPRARASPSRRECQRRWPWPTTSWPWQTRPRPTSSSTTSATPTIRSSSPASSPRPSTRSRPGRSLLQLRPATRPTTATSRTSAGPTAPSTGLGSRPLHELRSQRRHSAPAADHGQRRQHERSSSSSTSRSTRSSRPARPTWSRRSSTSTCSTTTGTIVASGTNNNIATQEPLQFVTNIPAGSYFVAIQVVNGPDPGTVEFVQFGDSRQRRSSPGSSARPAAPTIRPRSATTPLGDDRRRRRALVGAASLPAARTRWPPSRSARRARRSRSSTPTATPLTSAGARPEPDDHRPRRRQHLVLRRSRRHHDTTDPGHRRPARTSTPRFTPVAGEPAQLLRHVLGRAQRRGRRRPHAPEGAAATPAQIKAALIASASTTR